jgi:hypothetical protein
MTISPGTVETSDNHLLGGSKADEAVLTLASELYGRLVVQQHNGGGRR